MPRQTLALVALLSAVSLLSATAKSQSAPSVALPSTMTTMAGSAPAATTAGGVCPTLSSATATDAYGDGCPAVNGVFGAAGRGGVQVDSFGNVFVADDVDNVIHMINPTSGLMTRIAGGGSVCAATEDAAGDGCAAATQTLAKGQRGIGIDPYGNVLLAGYSDNLVHVVCRTSSPLCSAAQIGTMQLVAGCSQGTGSNGTGGAGLDNVPAVATDAGTCTTAKGEVDAPRGATADQFGNVYFADTSTSRTRVVVGPLTSSFFSGNNPIYAALGVYYPSVTAGYVYSVVNTTGTSTSTGGTATTQGASCSVTTNGNTFPGTALDTLGDGCPLEFSSVKASSGYTSGVAVDAAGNMLFTDPTHGLRVFFVSNAGAAGILMQAAIIANNPGVTPQVGFIYLLAGGGTTSLSSAPALGTSTAVTDTTITKVTVSPQGGVFIGDNNRVLFFDLNTGYIRTLFTSSANVTAGNYCNGSSGQQSLSAYSDGCPASQSLFSNNNGLGVAVDGRGNLYLYDASSNTNGMLVRKVLAQGFAQQTIGTPLTQDFKIHLPETGTVSVAGVTAASTPAPDMSVGTPSCSQNADNSVDCNVNVTTTPSAAGERSAALNITLPSASASANIALSGTASGSVLALDAASTTISGTTTPVAPASSTLLPSIDPAGVAVDGAGNVYAMDLNSGSIVSAVQGSGMATLSSGLPANPAQIALDQQGDVFTVGSGTAAIQEMKLSGVSSYSATSISYTPLTGTAAPQAIAVDGAGNLFVADVQSPAPQSAIFRISTAPNTLEAQTTIATGFTNPVSLAVDGAGNVYVADKGTGAVYRLAPNATGAYTQTTAISKITPVSVAVDPAGDLYVQDAGSGSILEVPVSGTSQVTVFSGLVAPAGLAVDGKGNVYSADQHTPGITEIVRDAVTYDFGTSESTTFSGVLTDVGNAAVTGSNPVTNTTNFNVTGGSSNGCSFANSILGALPPGDACTLSASLVGAGTGGVTNVLSFLPAASTVGSLTLTGTLEGTAIATTTTISGPSPSAPSYSNGGTEATFTVTVSAASGVNAPGGTVAVTIDSNTGNPTLTASGTSGVATVIVTGLTAGTHTISAVYSTNGSFTGSGSGTTTFSIGQIATSATWTPGSTTQPIGQAIGTGVLDAGVSPAVPGTFSYTAIPSSGSPVIVDASTYLPIGVYSLAVTFTPTDAVDYTTSTATIGSYTVTKADTTATAGASTNVVAADGSGDYTTLSAALMALPTTGGTIYLKPGMYTGQNAISYPNVALRGLGGDATKVILTGEDGAFSAPFVYPGSGPGNASASGDQGSSTLDVAKSAWIGNQPTQGSVEYSPNNFYAEYLTIQNTYNTDTTTTSTYSTASGSCADTGVAQTLQSLYNSEQQCNSQALALWITADQALLNNIDLTSQQDTLYAGSQGCGSGCTPARQYMWQGTITGNVDYVFGDAAMVFDHTNFFTTWHGTSATGTETIEAQNKKFETGSTSDYLSGYICNACTLMSQSTGMSNLYYGRPYGPYSTWIMLNSNVDQVNPIGWIEFSGDTNLTTSTYAEFNSQPYTDPAVGTPPYPSSLFGGTVTPMGGNSGAGVNGTRETTSTDPGTAEASNAVHTNLTAAQAAQYYPVAFLSATVPAQSYIGFTSNWNPVTALASAVNSFAPSGNITLNAYGESVTILGRPQTPGAGIIPTGTYQFLDGSTVLASGTLDASGEAYFTTSTLSTGSHTITMVYGGDSNFNGSTSAPFTITVPAAPLTSTTTLLTVSSTSSQYGSGLTGTVTVSPSSGSGVPTGTVSLVAGGVAVGSCTLASGVCSYSLTGIPAGVQSFIAQYTGDGMYAASTSSNITLNIARALLQVSANSYTIAIGAALPTYAATLTGFVNGDTQASAVTGSPAFSAPISNSNAPGTYSITVTTGTLSANNYTFSFTGGYLRIVPAAQAAAVATGDSRNVTEPVIPAVCTTLTAALTSVNNDLPTSVDATVSNPDGTRVQAALNSCSGTGQAVELSLDGAGHDSFLTGPLNMPSGVTLLVDPGVTVFFSRNVQDYDLVPGTHTCGTVNSSSATSSCQPLININNVSNVGIMGFGKLDGRGGDTLLNAFPASYAGQSWWGLSAIADSGGNQQNPRFIQMSNASNVTLYKITLRNSPLFHVSTTGGEGVNGFTAWDIKIITPTSSRNTDGIDPGNAQNVTITRSWVSDGDDNVAVGAANSIPSMNISVTNDYFFAGHGESIGSITEAGVSNVLFDGNMLSGNESVDTNSTGIRIKSGNDRGGVVTNIQYSNSCFQNHKAEIQFTPLYDTTPGTETPNFENILMQNLTFLTEGTVQFTGASNGSTVNPLTVTLDNVNFNTLAANDFVTTGTEGTETNAQLTYGPGDVSSNFISAWATFVGSNGDTAMNNITASSVYPPACNFTEIAPELTGPSGLPQNIVQGDNATAVVILTPAVAGDPYPTGGLTLTDGESSTTTVTLQGTSDTVFIPLTGLSVGTHTFTASYAGDSNYVPAVQGSPYTTTAPYVITVNAGNLSGTMTGLSDVPTSTPYGSSFTATATVTGTNPTGSVEFVVNGVGYATANLSASGGSDTATASITLPYNTTPYSVEAVYSGDTANAGSFSATDMVTVTAATTVTTLATNTTTTTLGHPVTLTATVTPTAGVSTGSVSFSYTTVSSTTPVSLTSAVLNNGVGTVAVDLPMGTDTVTATYQANGSFAGSVSAPLTITVNPPAVIPLSNGPIALPYTMTTIAGGAASNCSTAADKYGNGCPGSQIVLNGSLDLRSVTADPFGNIYFTDANASEVRRIAPNGVVSDFAGFVSGTACVPTATNGCTPSLVKLNKPRGVAADSLGNVYIAGYSDNKVYKYSVSTGLLYLVAGTGTAGTPTGNNGDGGPATSANVFGPRGVWADSLGDIYIADTTDNKIREVDTTGTIQTIAGTGVSSSTGDGGAATLATISNPQGVAVDANLNVYIADSGSIRVICVTCSTGSPLDQLLNALGITAPQNGDIYTLAGGASSSYAGSFPTLATNVKMSPQKLAFDNSQNLYISDGNGVVWFLDSHTAHIRPIAGNVTTNCSAETDSVGDGCPAAQAVIGDGGNGIGVGADSLGNIYISDTLNARIRKVVTGLQSGAVAVTTPMVQPIELHFVPNDTLAASNGLAYLSSEWALSTPTCIANSDATSDCSLSSTFTPAVPGARSAPLAVNSSGGNTALLALTGTGLGAGATLDPASQSSFGTNLQAAGLAVDNAGSVYVSDTNSKQLLRFTAAAATQGSSAPFTVLATLTAPGAVAVDPRGYVYVADTSTGQITQISPAGATSTLPFTFTHPSGLAVDALNNLYVSDSAAKAVYQVSPITAAQRTLPMGTLVAPAGLTLDPAGNLLVADPGAPAILRFNLTTNTVTIVSTPAVSPSAALSDAAGNLLIADSGSILAVPVSGNSAPFTVAAIAPLQLAVDAAGDLYTGSGGSILKLTRTQGYLQFSVTSTAPLNASMLESGNQPLQLSSISQTDTTDYSLTSSPSTDCSVSVSGPGTLAVGGVCSLSAAYTPTTYATTTDTATLNGNVSNASLSAPSSVQLVLTGPTTPPTAMLTLGTSSPASPVYGQSVTVTATVSGLAVTPGGSVAFTIDGTDTITASLTGGVATATFSGLTAGTHTLSAVYISSNGYGVGSSATTALVVAQASSVVALAATPNPAAQGSPELLTAMVTGPGQPTGTVIFTSGTATLCTAPLNVSGTASCSFTPTTSGSLTISANYLGDANHLGALAGIVLNVYDTNIHLQLASTQLVYPGATNVTVCVSSTTHTTPTGTIQILDSANVLTTQRLGGGGCAYWYISPGLAAGTHVLSAVYSGDLHNPAGASAPAVVTVSPVPVTMAASCWNSSFAYGANYQCTVNVSSRAGAAQGEITYSVDGGAATPVTLNGGNAQFAIVKPAVGSHSVVIGYAQQTNYAAATPSDQEFTVTPAPVNVLLTPLSWYASAGTTLTFKVTVTSWSAGPPDATGAVSFYDGSTLLASIPVNSDGQASYATAALSRGSHKITTTYQGGMNYGIGSASATITIAP